MKDSRIEMSRLHVRIRGALIIIASVSSLLFLSGCGVMWGSVSYKKSLNGTFSVFPPSITLPAGSQYTYVFQPTNGMPPYAYAILSGPGSIDASGVYTAGLTTGTTTIQVTDSQGNSSTTQVNNLQSAVNGIVNTIAIDGSGNQYLGGSFTAAFPYVAHGGLLLDTSTGTPTLSFDLQSGFNGEIAASVFLPDGSVIVGGLFTSYRGTPANHIAKLNSLGVLDTRFDPSGTGFNGEVCALAVSGTSLFAGGTFTTYRGAAANYIAKMDTTNGTLDSTFDPSGSGFNGQVKDIVITGSNLFVGGAFSNYRGAAANYIAKMDTTNGTLDTTFDPSGSGFDSFVYALAVSGTNLFAGGEFATYRGSAAAFIAKVDTTNGTLDTTFDPSGSGFDSYVYALAVSGTSLFAGGDFATYRGSTANYIAKMDTTNGTLDTTFDPSGNGFDLDVFILTVSGNNLFVGGDFANYRGAKANGIAKLDTTNGTLDTMFGSSGTGFNGSASTFAISGTNLFVGGSFTTYRGSTANHIVKIDANGTLDTAFDPSGAGFNGIVSAFTITGGNLFAGGVFTTYRGSTANYIAKMDTTNGTLDATFDPSGTGFNGSVDALTISGTSLFAGGNFTTYGGSTANHIAKLDTTNGTLDTTFDPSGTGFNNDVSALAASGTNLFVGGFFTTYRGSTANYIAKLDTTNGTLDTTFDPSGTGFNSSVFTLAVSGTNLFAGGFFTTYRGSTANYIAKLDTTNGTLDTTFDPSGTGFNGRVTATVISGTSLFAGGVFTAYGGSTANYIAKIDTTNGVLDAIFDSSGAGFNSGVNAAVISGTSLFVGGAFSSYQGSPMLGYGALDATSGSPLP